ncbi:PLDc N-terminal domain-containing protein [Litoribacter ruber]|uniref:PLDc N-terminal domain-containing protein n=1 Tax=Litoribacter ruber TaxID=702568 RepID=A0AAP2CLG7_9BACT|nr:MULTISPECIES: PLDc N-terminal domain-containing protein [Litoribacter]MBS9524775.1 PLDc N-terminal domain-containing protein [Litoribacter alkaliphilus]MBT0812642.1 PLDc N-terminal domain-containing protein [Litoribacter ruber]
MDEFDLPPFIWMGWKVAGGIILIFFVIALVMILNNKALPTREKMLWMWGSFLLPILGPLLYIVLGRYGK